jgi:hypothetical protein
MNIEAANENPAQVRCNGGAAIRAALSRAFYCRGFGMALASSHAPPRRRSGNQLERGSQKRRQNGARMTRTSAKWPCPDQARPALLVCSISLDPELCVTDSSPVRLGA